MMVVCVTVVLDDWAVVVADGAAAATHPSALVDVLVAIVVDAPASVRHTTIPAVYHYDIVACAVENVRNHSGVYYTMASNTRTEIVC